MASEYANEAGSPVGHVFLIEDMLWELEAVQHEGVDVTTLTANVQVLVVARQAEGRGLSEPVDDGD